MSSSAPVAICTANATIAAAPSHHARPRAVAASARASPPNPALASIQRATRAASDRANTDLVSALFHGERRRGRSAEHVAVGVEARAVARAEEVAAPAAPGDEAAEMRARAPVGAHA